MFWSWSTEWKAQLFTCNLTNMHRITMRLRWYILWFLLRVFLLLIVTIKNACLTFSINHYSPCTMGHKELNQNGWRLRLWGYVMFRVVRINFCKQDISRHLKIKIKSNIRLFMIISRYQRVWLPICTRFSTRTRTIETLRYPFPVYGYG